MEHVWIFVAVWGLATVCLIIGMTVGRAFECERLRDLEVPVSGFDGHTHEWECTVCHGRLSCRERR